MPRLLLLACLLALPALAGANERFVFDPNHSSVAFSIRHFLAAVPGQFAKVSGQIDLDPADFTRSCVSATIDLASVTTLVAQRDEHLRSADFFDATKNPTATFTSTVWTKTGEDTYDVRGTLSLHGVTREITLPVRYLGRAPGNRGALLTGWEATVVLKRSDFGIGKPEKAIGDDVRVVINVEAKLQKPEGAAP